MMSYHKLIIIGILFIGCKNTSTNEKHNQALINELQKMANIDQIVADIPKGKYKELTKAQWKQFKDSVFKVNQKRAKEMLDTYGFIGYDLAGEKGSHHFWLIVQHSDHNPIFQKEVLNKMKKHVFQKMQIQKIMPF